MSTELIDYKKAFKDYVFDSVRIIARYKETVGIIDLYEFLEDYNYQHHPETYSSYKIIGLASVKPTHEFLKILHSLFNSKINDYNLYKKFVIRQTTIESKGAFFPSSSDWFSENDNWMSPTKLNVLYSIENDLNIDEIIMELIGK